MTTNTTNLTTAAVNAAVVSSNSNTQQLVTCVTGGYRFALPTTHLSGVYQVARQQLGTNLEVLSTPEGDLPVASLATLLSLHHGLDVTPSDQERALVAIRSGNKVATIRVGQLSRPIDASAQHWHRIPNVAHPAGKARLFSHITNINPQSDNPDEALTLVVDPLKALGFENDDSNSPLVKDAATAAAGLTDLTDLTESAGASATVPTRRGSDHLISFVPEDVPRQNLNFVFCLPLASVAAVVTSHPLMTAPFQNEIFSGYILWRKIPVPIIRLSAAFDMDSHDGEKRKNRRGRRLVIARASGHRYVGFYTQTQMHSMKIPTASTTNLAELKGHPHMGAFKTDFGVMVIPDLDSLLALEN
jgi:chemotaxis signal transduction protein